MEQAGQTVVQFQEIQVSSEGVATCPSGQGQQRRGLGLARPHTL